jgi:hypothetical protein
VMRPSTARAVTTSLQVISTLMSPGVNVNKTVYLLMGALHLIACCRRGESTPRVGGNPGGTNADSTHGIWLCCLATVIAPPA